MRYSFKTYILLPIFFFSFLLSCGKKSEEPQLENVFENWAKRGDQAKLDLFKSSPVDDSGKALQLIASVIDSIDKEISVSKKLNEQVDSIFTWHRGTRKAHLGVAFHAYLNGDDIFSPEVMTKSRKIMQYYSYLEVKVDEIENERIARKNYASINVGDSFLLILPVKNKYGHSKIFFTMGYPNSNKYSFADDSLSMRLVLVDKLYGKKTDLSIDSTCLSFKGQIIELNNPNVEGWDGEKFKIGKQFDFCLQNYGRIIKH